MHEAADRRSVDPGATGHRISDRALGLLALPVVMTSYGIWSISRGQDVNYDQRNYHIYTVWALFHDRLDVDFAPAGIGTFLLPFHNIPFVYLALNAPPQLTGFVMGAAHGIAAWLVVVITWRLLPDVRRSTRISLALLAGIAGSWTPGVISTIGTSFGDISTAIPILAALAILIRPNAAIPGNRLIAAAGLLCGFGVALKATQAVYAAGFLAALLVFWLARRLQLRSVVLYGITTGAAFLVTSSYWMWQLWSHYESPVFPQFNSVFQSPYYPKITPNDARWRVHGLVDALETPLQFAGSSMRYAEAPLRDIRWLVLIILAVVLLALRRPPIRWLRTAPFGEVLLVLFVLFGFLFWLKAWTYDRYLVPVELVSGTVLLIGLRSLAGDTERLLATYAVAVACMLVAVVSPEFGHLPWGNQWYAEHLPAIAFKSNTMVVMATTEPISYVIPAFPESTRFVRVFSSGFIDTPARSRYTDDMSAAIRGHRGPLLLLAFREDLPVDGPRITSYGLKVSSTRCFPIVDRLRANLVLCEIIRSPT